MSDDNGKVTLDQQSALGVLLQQQEEEVVNSVQREIGQINFHDSEDRELVQKAIGRVRQRVDEGEFLDVQDGGKRRKLNSEGGHSQESVPNTPDVSNSLQETEQNTKPDFLEKILSQKEKTVLARVATIIDTHTNVRSGDGDYISAYRDPFFWRDTVNEFRQGRGESSLFDISEEDRNSYQSSKIGRYYRTQGMYIQEGSEQYEVLKEVMDYIRNDRNSSQNIKKVIDAQRTAVEHDKLLEQTNSRSVDENEMGKDIIMFAGNKYRLREEHRAEYEMDTIEELYVKAVAVSIMAETDGRSNTAKEILENGGMDVVKNLEPESVADLLVDLQIIALEGEEEQIDFSRDGGGRGL